MRDEIFFFVRFLKSPLLWALNKTKTNVLLMKSQTEVIYQNGLFFLYYSKNTNTKLCLKMTSQRLGYKKKTTEKMIQKIQLYIRLSRLFFCFVFAILILTHSVARFFVLFLLFGGADLCSFLLVYFAHF